MTDLGPDFLFRPKGGCDLCERTAADVVSIPNNYTHDTGIDLCSSCLKLAHAFLLKAVSDRLPKQEPQPRPWELWMEGYMDTGCEGIPAPPSLLGTVTALSLDEAMQKHVKTLSKKDADYYVRRPDGTWTCWSCRIFDNKKDATLARD